MRYLLYALLIWFLYNLVFKLIIPVYKTTRLVKKKFREMHEQMTGEPVNQQNHNAETSTQKSSSESQRSQDYIDFEEIK